MAKHFNPSTNLRHPRRKRVAAATYRSVPVVGDLTPYVRKLRREQATVFRFLFSTTSKVSILITHPTKTKMKLAILASLVASAAAFAPSKQAASSTALNAFENELGAQKPLG